MPDKDPFPEGVQEIGSIRISVGINQHGTGTGYSIDGLSEEAAIGHLTAALDSIRDRVRDKFAPDLELFPVSLECPECGHLIELNGDVDGEFENEDDED